MGRREEISFEQYIKEHKELLTKEFKNLKEKDFISMNVRNPEDPKQTIEWYFHKYQYEKLKKDSMEFDIPKEELAFISLMYTLEASEIIPNEEKQNIREFLKRQMARIKNNVNKMLLDSLENITVMQLKDKIQQLYSIPIKEFDKMEHLWREEFKKSDYKDEDTYVKIKLASLL